jgi:hypothetical protein
MRAVRPSKLNRAVSAATSTTTISSAKLSELRQRTLFFVLGNHDQRETWHVISNQGNSVVGRLPLVALRAARQFDPLSNSSGPDHIYLTVDPTQITPFNSSDATRAGAWNKAAAMNPSIRTKAFAAI